MKQGGWVDSRLTGTYFRKQGVIPSYDVHVIDGKPLKSREAFEIILEPWWSERREISRCGVVPNAARLEMEARSQHPKEFSLHRILPVLQSSAYHKLKTKMKPGIRHEYTQGPRKPFVFPSTKKGLSPVYRRPPSSLGTYEIPQEMRLKEVEDERSLIIGPPTFTTSPLVTRHVDVIPFDLNRTKFDESWESLMLKAKMRLAPLNERYLAKLRRFQRRKRAREPMPVLRQIALEVKRQKTLFNLYSS